MKLIANNKGNYQFLSGIAPFSSGVAALEGYEIVHATLKSPIPYRCGFDVIDEYLTSLGRPRHALCAIELRSPKPFSFDGFDEFNKSYLNILAEWGLLFNGYNPIARTNIAPVIGAPKDPSLYAFSYTIPVKSNNFNTFVISGGGEMGEGKRSPETIIRYGETSVEALTEKAQRVVEIMHSRLNGLKLTWPEVTAIDIYTIHPIHPFLPEIILKSIDKAAVHGIRWFYGRPPIIGLEFEMDLRRIRSDIVL